MAWIVMSLISTVFTILLYHVIDPDLPALLKEETVEKTIETMEAWGLPEKDIEEALKRMEEEDITSVGTLFKNFFWSLIFGFIVAAIIALVIKKGRKDTISGKAGGEQVLDS